MTAHENPFRIGVLAEGVHFADREEEVARVERALGEPGARLVVYGDRRLGKSSVLHEVVGRIRNQERGAAVVVSLATASSEGEAAQRLLGALQSEIGATWRDFLEEVARALEAGLELTADPVTGQPRIRLGLGRRSDPRPEWPLPRVLDALQARLEREHRTLGLCLDEFQRLHQWGGEDAEWALREAIQRHTRIAYVFAGSKRSLIEGMVTTKGRALWKQADVLPFGPIRPEILGRWIWSRMRETGVEIDRRAAERIVALTHPRTRDVVQLARACWPGEGGTVSRDAADVAFEQLVSDQSALHARVWRGLGRLDQEVLRVFAIPPDPEDVRITAAETLDRYALGPKSTVKNAVERLVEAEHLVHTEGGYAFDDPYFRRWIQRNALADLGLPVPPLRP